ncbi:MAG: Ig-like domain-containing protein [Opitutales bacterium]|nr:Ig-like domain-containing protein [Opitutales bacterium]
MNNSLLRWLSGCRIRFRVCSFLPLMAAAGLFAQDDGIGGDPDREPDPVDERRERVRTVIAREDVSGGGRFFYVIFRAPTEDDLADPEFNIESRVVARGDMGFEGISRIILAPQTDYEMYALYAESLMFGATTFRTPRAGETFTIPRMGFFDLDDVDTDLDGLSDIREFVVGTDPLNPDTSGDGVLDGTAVRQGINPLAEGMVAATGIIGTAPVEGVAHDITAVNNIAVLAARAGGVTVFNVDSSRAPTRIAQVDTPGDAFAVAAFGTRVAVADSSAGLTVVDISDPAGAAITFTRGFGQPVYAVAVYGSIAIVGTNNGLLVTVDMMSGAEIDRHRSLSGRIWDLAVTGDTLYVLRAGTVSVFRIDAGGLEFIRNVTAQGSAGAGQRSLKLFVGTDKLYTTFFNGLNVFSIADPWTPVLEARHTTAQQGWKQIAPTGSGLAVATVSPNSTPDGPHHVSLYSIGEDGTELDFLTEFETPGLASSLVLYNGRAFIADSTAGLQVINYLAFDRFGVPPTIELATNAVDGKFEEGKLMDVSALAWDDVQVRNVQFFVDGEIRMTDGNYPFGFRLLTPLLAEKRTHFDLHAVATDTGGNSTTSETLTIELVPDMTPPRVRSVDPGNGRYIGEARIVTAVMSEPIDTATLTAESFRLVGAGEDNIFDTADDTVVAGSLSFDVATNRARFTAATEVPQGRYQVRIGPPLADLAGNVIEDTFVSSFIALGHVDSSGDGLPDWWKIQHGLDPFSTDTGNTGVPDWMRDMDGDGLINIGEFLLGTDPRNRDTSGDGIWDGHYDTSGDGLTDGQKILLGLDPFKVDTDGDGVSDYDEINEGTDPLDPNSFPKTRVMSPSIAYLNAEPHAPLPGETVFTVVSRPASYLNAFPAAPDDDVVFHVASPAASFLNALFADDEGQVAFAAASMPVSYLNAVPLESEEDEQIAISPIVSFEAVAP